MVHSVPTDKTFKRSKVELLVFRPQQCTFLQLHFMYNLSLYFLFMPQNFDTVNVIITLLFATNVNNHENILTNSRFEFISIVK